MATLSEAFALAIQHHQAGRLPAAEQLYRQILAHDPQHVDAMHMLGVIAFQVGQVTAAIGLYDKVLALKPNFAEALGNQGTALLQLGDLERAIAAFRQAIRLKPIYPEAHNNLGCALRANGLVDEAIESYRRAVHQNPKYFDCFNNLGVTLCKQRKHSEGIAAFKRAIALKPDLAEAHYNLGLAYTEVNRLADAVHAYRQAVAIKPDYLDAQINLGNTLRDQGELDAAEVALRRAIEIKPDHAQSYNNLGNVLKDQGRLREAISAFRRALELKPDYASAHSNLLLSLHYCPELTVAELAVAHAEFNTRHAEPLAVHIRPHTNDRTLNRKLRIGYVSPDLYLHPVGRFMLPAFEAHDRSKFEIYVYSSVLSPDDMTAQCRNHCDVWRDVFNWTDEQLAEGIRQDQVDILVDLSMHTGKNRLLVFARKPAPVQVTYLGSVATTGLRAIDYRLTDPYLDPPRGTDDYYSEESIRLPEVAAVYRPACQTSAVAPLPATKPGVVTFGCLNNFCKISAEAIELWCRILKALPESRLLLHVRPPSQYGRVQAQFAEQGISPDRVTFVEAKRLPEYFKTYEQIDIALDPFPYNGGTTTFDSLWMGVPVISLLGHTAVGRAGMSILVNVGLAELVAKTPEEYLEIAIMLANDIPRLSKMRSTLRATMESSPLMDAPRFARNVEAAYRQMWERFCSQSEGKAVPLSS